MTEEKTEGAAFPNNFSLPENQGLTLRDYFAAQAMQALIIASTSLGEDEDQSFQKAAFNGFGAPTDMYDSDHLPYSYSRLTVEEAYGFADEMIAHRNK